MSDRAVLDWMAGNLRLLGAAAVAIAAVTWVVDVQGWVYACPYCRVQRTAIGLVGLAMMLPDPRAWWVRYGAATVAFLGASVAAAQLFLVFRNVTAGQPSNPLNGVLAAAALFILVGQVLLLFVPKPVR